MRGFHTFRLALPYLTAARTQHDGGRKSRAEVLSRWNAVAPAAGAVAVDPAAPAASASVGKGMSFASGILGRKDGGVSSRAASEASTIADVKWDVCERMDYYVQYCLPSTWSLSEAVRENSVSIQCSPPLEPPTAAGAGGGKAASRPSVHGISVNCFAYKQRVAQPDSGKLLNIFLKRFNASVGNSLQIVSEYAATKPGLDKSPSSIDAEMGHSNISEMLATRLNSAVAEITFTPGAGQPLAHGICRAFFNSNCRFHYVVVVAVPDDEFLDSQDLIINTLMSVVESRVESAAKRT